jgi:hypothetical protein
VHALRHVHQLLVPGGVLVDLHPITEQRIERHGQYVATLEEPEWIADILPNAERRLQEAIADGLYVVEDEIEYDFLQHFDAIEDLVDAKRDLVEAQEGLVERIQGVGAPLVTRERYVGRRLRVT